MRHLLFVSLLMLIGCEAEAPRAAKKTKAKEVAAPVVAKTKADAAKFVPTKNASSEVWGSLTKEDTQTKRWHEIYREEVYKDPAMALLRTQIRYADEKKGK